MNIDPQFESGFVRIVGVMGFVLATVAFFLMLSGMTEYQGQEAGTMMFIGFIICTALAFAGLMISTLAQVLSTLQSMEKLMREQNGKLDKLANAPAKKAATKKTPAKKSTT